MTISRKLQAIQRLTGLTQTQLASRFGVSFVTLNRWLGGKASPRQSKEKKIDSLYREMTGQEPVPPENLRHRKSELHKLSQANRGVIRSILTNPDVHDSLILKCTFHTNRLEGSTLTEKETAAVMFDDVALPDKTLSEQMEARNHQAALNYLLGHVAGHGPLDENFILRLHAILMNGIRPDAGRYRNHAVRIVGANVPTANHLKLPELMGEVAVDLERAEGQQDIMTDTTAIHARFEQVHPFSDGNGRIGRLIMAAILLRADMAPPIIRQERKMLYLTYLQKAQTGNDQSRLEDFLCEAVLDGYRIINREW